MRLSNTNITKPILNVVCKDIRALNQVVFNQAEQVKATDVKSIYNTEYKTNKNDFYNTYFSFNQKTIGFDLSNKNREKLQEFFNEDNFKYFDDKLILQKDAASYVGSWFNYVAFKQNYLNADINKNGVLNKTEMLDIKLQFPNSNVFTNISKTDIDCLELLGELQNYTSISNMMNYYIQDDKNYDLAITGLEKNGVAGINYVVEIIMNNIDKNKLQQSITKATQEDIKRQSDLANALIKINNDDYSKLSEDEKKILNSLNIEINLINIIGEDKINELVKNNKLDDFIDFTKDFLEELNNIKLINIKV
ncbi:MULTISPECIES: hypothetical protein [unclassified Campylobacter]|uniref:hypothetical protein n=2 Tax=Campylobacter TaxID=194 RepID=UPI001BD930FF|nr:MULTISPECIES: hypothetical protein [unclassified Campylobacter]MBZ7978623.1 hypothetical protein [Campylobacter sp. RM12654]MBZ7982543.1 hypothetical protein [Campylobacter sp. RM12640]MBZ7989736.1 hypothetical protein [Campylobacter sp. RM12635]MBZ7991568.1 hypothetical protein [Campylobacter sp. RM9331]MBZ7993248.1 hypothetical protein [Campylobacter sp. RM9333]MBZ8005958.1 hypothetical protein [Campylobacter sp. RM9332]